MTFNRLSLTAFIALLMVVTGCGPKVTLTPEYEAEKPHILAFLPIKADSSIRKERMDYLRRAMASQLQSRGIYLLDERIIARECDANSCSNHGELGKKYSLDGFITLQIDAVSRANFGLGYYNSIDGSLSVTDKNDRELLQIAHTESERGGLIFESGQVFQGIKETIENIENAGDDSFNKLAEKFASTIAAKVPSYGAQEKSDKAVSVMVDAVEVKELKPDIYSVCASGTPNSLASLVVGRQKTNLREVSTGQYCGTYRLSNALTDKKNVALELRSPFGNPVRRPVELSSTKSL